MKYSRRTVFLHQQVGEERIESKLEAGVGSNLHSSGPQPHEESPVPALLYDRRPDRVQ